MQTLPDLKFAERDEYPAFRYRMTEFLERIVRVVNHNARDFECLWTMEAPANGTYPVWVPLSGRNIVEVGFVLQAGTCTATVSHGSGPTSVSWQSAGGTALSVTTAAQTDKATSGGSAAAGSAVSVALSSVSGAAGLSMTIRTGR